MRKPQKGFTLIELLVVIAIIGLLSTLAIVSFSGAQERARDANRVSDIRQIQTAMESYNAQYATYLIPGCPTGTLVSACTNAELNEIIPQRPQFDDPKFVKANFCILGETDCNYAFGTTATDSYDVFFATENDDVQGLDPAEKSHTLDENGLDSD